MGKHCALVMNLADPSPGQGWLCRERRPLHQRTQPELILCLAVIHHLVIRENLLLDDVVRCGWPVSGPP